MGKTRLLQSEEEVVETQNWEHQLCLQDFELGGLRDFFVYRKGL